MENSIQFTDADRNDRGRIRLPGERSLAELLPNAADEGATPPSGPARRLPWPPTRQQQVTAAGIAGGLILALALIALIGRTPTPAPRSVPTPAPRATAAATAAPTLAPTAPPIAAFWAPGGERAPDLAADTALTPTARYGDTWVLVALPGGGAVWIGRADAEQRGLDWQQLPDRAPQPTPPPPPPAAPRPVFVPAAAPAVPACTLPDRPSHTSTRQVQYRGVPIGQVTGIGCSQGEADQNAEGLAAYLVETARHQAAVADSVATTTPAAR